MQQELIFRDEESKNQFFHTKLHDTSNFES